jgi:hypothetical protein
MLHKSVKTKQKKKRNTFFPKRHLVRVLFSLFHTFFFFYFETAYIKQEKTSMYITLFFQLTCYRLLFTEKAYTNILLVKIRFTIYIYIPDVTVIVSGR